MPSKSKIGTRYWILQEDTQRSSIFWRNFQRIRKEKKDTNKQEKEREETNERLLEECVGDISSSCCDSSGRLASSRVQAQGEKQGHAHKLTRPFMNIKIGKKKYGSFSMLACNFELFKATVF